MLKEITIGNQKRPIYFGFNALYQFCEEINIQYGELMTSGVLSDLSNQIKLMRVGLVEGSRKSGGEKFAPTMVQMFDWIDETPEAIEASFEIFAEQMQGVADKRNAKVEKKLTSKGEKES